MSRKVKIRARLKNGVTTVKALMTHPMETGSRKDRQTGEFIPAHFIKEIVVTHNNNPVLNANWGTGISQNPYLSFKIKGGGAGDTVAISWLDNLGESGSGETQIKQK